jgi:hypothetical protein
MIRKEDFKLGYPEKCIEDEYVYETEEFLLIIPLKYFDDEMIKYANKIINLYFDKKEEVMDYVVESEDGIYEFYNQLYGYSKEFVKNNLGKPWIIIDFKKTEEYPKAKYNYGGQLEYVESNLDEHIIDVEFGDDLVLYGDVGLNG